MAASSATVAALVARCFQRAVANFQEHHLSDAEALCAEVLRHDPRHFDALHLRGLVALQGGQIHKSIESIRQSLALNPNQPVAHMNLANALLRAGKPHAALISSATALELRPNYAEALNSRGNVLLQLGRPEEALANYDRGLQLRPELALLHNNRGKALRDLQRPTEALESYQRALRLQPNLRESLVGGAEILRALSRPREALALCEQCLQHNPDDVEALHLRAKTSLDLGLRAEALADLDLALGVRPHASELLLDRGNVLCQLKRAEDALAAYRRVLELSPGSVEALFNQGNALLLLKRHDEALESYERAIAIQPQYAKAHSYRGNTLRALSRQEESLVSYTRALACDPRYLSALIGKGNVLRDLGRLSEALASYDEVLRLDPSSLEALSNRSLALMMVQRWEEAAEGLQRVLELDPESGPELNYSLGFLLQSRLNSCDWRDYDSITRAIEAGIRSDKRVTVPSLYTASGLAPEIHLRCAQAFVSDNCQAANALSSMGPNRAHGRIRLAYVSADYCEHPVSMLMANLFEGHDRARFECLGIAIRAQDGSAMAGRVKRAFDRFIDVTSYSDRDAAALLRELEIDICIDLTGYTAHMRAGIFAHRSAPVQVNYLGYPGTLGAPYMDYILADRSVIPVEDQSCYSEKVAYLPHSFLPPGDPRATAEGKQTRTDCGLPEQGLVFCGFNSHGKIAPPVFDIWMRLLHAVEGSVLWLNFGSQAVTRNLTQEAARRGVAPERIVFAPRMPELEQHLARYRLADLFLDTLPYNAHTTASDALWAGLPVLTCRGASFPGRVAAGLLSALELPELIASDLQDYESRALNLAGNPTLLTQLRDRMVRHRGTHPLFDADRFRQDLESAYITMWERFRRGELPKSFAVDAPAAGNETGPVSPRGPQALPH
jgi:protein O-GlcNAc transferase